MARVITAQATSPSSDSERIYACQHCPKRYARKDYLERHELNHTRPGSVCPACGKGFARPDVLRKHLSTSCKSRRGSDGDAPAPLTTAEEDALVPRKRRRPQRRSTAGVSESLSPSSSDDGGGPSRRPPPPRLTQSYDDSYEYPPAPLSASSSTSGSARFPGRRELDAHARFAPSLRLQMPQLSPTRFERPTDPSPDGAARIGASLEIPLAPAYAATPEALDPLFSSKDTDWHAAATTASAHAAAAKLDLQVYSMMPITSTLQSPVVTGVHPSSATDASTSPVVAPAVVNNTTPWSQPAETAGPASNNNMDDLFSWLFTMTNTTGTSVSASSDMDPSSMLKLSEQAVSAPERSVLLDAASAPSVADSDDDSDHISGLFSSPFSQSALRTKRPRDAHDADSEGPLYTRKHDLPKLPLAFHETTPHFTPLSFSGRGSCSYRMPQLPAALDEQGNSSPLSLLDDSTRAELFAQAVSLGQMKLPIELSFM